MLKLQLPPSKRSPPLSHQPPSKTQNYVKPSPLFLNERGGAHYVFVAICLDPLVPGVHEKVTHTLKNLQVKAADSLKYA